MSFFTYILYSKTFDKFYYGQTNNLESRLTIHNSGKVKSTARYIPWKLFAFKEFKTRKEAFAFETKLKNLKSRIRVANFIQKNQFKVIESLTGPEKL